MRNYSIIFKSLNLWEIWLLFSYFNVIQCFLFLILWCLLSKRFNCGIVRLSKSSLLDYDSFENYRRRNFGSSKRWVLLRLHYWAVWTIDFLNYWSFEILHVVPRVVVQNTISSNAHIMCAFELFFVHLIYWIHLNYIKEIVQMSKKIVQMIKKKFKWAKK